MVQTWPRLRYIVFFSHFNLLPFDFPHALMIWITIHTFAYNCNLEETKETSIVQLKPHLNPDQFSSCGENVTWWWYVCKYDIKKFVVLFPILYKSNQSHKQMVSVYFKDF